MHLDLRGAFEFPEVPDCPEGVESYEANAVAKALHYSGATRLPALADDSGIEVEALAGRPGVLSARFSGEGLSDEDRNRKLLEALQGVPPDRRRARYVAIVALAVGGSIAGIFRGEASGIILETPRGTRGFGYDPLFYYPDLHLTFAQMLPAVKRQVSHRGKALALACDTLRRQPGLLS